MNSMYQMNSISIVSQLHGGNPMHSNPDYIVAGFCGCSGNGPGLGCEIFQSFQKPESGEGYLGKKQILEEFLKEGMQGNY